MAHASTHGARKPPGPKQFKTRVAQLQTVFVLKNVQNHVSKPSKCVTYKRRALSAKIFQDLKKKICENVLMFAYGHNTNIFANARLTLLICLLAIVTIVIDVHLLT